MNKIKFWVSWLWAWFLGARVGRTYAWYCYKNDRTCTGEIQRLRWSNSLGCLMISVIRNEDRWLAEWDDGRESFSLSEFFKECELIDTSWGQL